MSVYCIIMKENAQSMNMLPGNCFYLHIVIISYL